MLARACVCVRVWEKEREREPESDSSVQAGEKMGECVRVCVCVRVCEGAMNLGHAFFLGFIVFS